ncbi:MAG: 50S ribosomal protein L5 [Candidatus Berkelbacteria bacterium]
MTNLKNTYNQEMKKTLKAEFGYKNDFQVPRITKVTINMGLGEAKDSDEILKNALSALEQISGQKPRINKSKKSISGFKLREGQVVGASVILRGDRMYDFITRFTSTALPRIRDFRGMNEKSFDKMGNFSVGIREHTIFPEIKFDQVKSVISLQVNVSTTAKNDAEGKRLLELFGFPFDKKVAAENIKIGEQNG